MDFNKLVNDLVTATTALKEIAKGEGRFSRDHHEHASNTIDDMKELATTALAKIEEGE